MPIGLFYGKIGSENLKMAGESAHFGLRQRSPMPAIRPFDLPPRLRSMLDQANAGLAQPFRGVGSGGSVSGLFPLARTGISTGSMVEAARSLLAKLTPEQRKAACFAIDDVAWRQWSNIHPWVMRHGACLADLGHDQRGGTLGRRREAMSAPGG